jgi:hypothetical protein
MMRRLNFSASHGHPISARPGFRERAGLSTSRVVLAVYCIEGDSVTLGDIARRLGVGINLARQRLARERDKPGPVTWAGLQSPT